KNRYVQVEGVNDFGVGTHAVYNNARIVKVSSINSLIFGTTKVFNKTSYIKLTGFVPTLYGTHNLKNRNQQLSVVGTLVGSYGKPVVYNLRQHISLSGRGFNTNLNGNAYVQGGVKYVTGGGFVTSAFGQTQVVNTRAHQDIDLRSPSRGIAPPSTPGPTVPPRILYPFGILPGPFGTAWVQRNPSPKGFTTHSYGTAWVSHSPRYLTPGKVDAFQP